MKPHPVIFGLLWFAGGVPLAAQAPAAAPATVPELSQTRRAYELQSLTRAKTLSEQYAGALANVMREAAAEGDYEQALTAQRRREQIVALYSNSMEDTQLATAIVLKPGDARVNGAVTYDRNANALVGWKTGSVAAWDVPRIPPGSYEITLTYSVAEYGEMGRVSPFAPAPNLDTGGDIEFYEDSSLPGAGQNRRTVQVTSTGGWEEWTTLTLPAIQVTRTPARFAMKVVKAKGGGGVLNLKSIRLAPPTGAPVNAGAPGTPSDTPTEAVDELAKLKQAHLDRLRQSITPIVNAYTDSMKALAAKYVINDVQAADDYNTESRRAARLLEDPQDIFSGPPKGPKQGMNAEGFHEMRDASFVTAPRSTGDSFKVRQGSEEFFVRLMWVTCPPVEAGQTKALKEYADYFGISTDDARITGEQARDFTANFLTGKTLTLYTRGTKDENGNLIVGVRPEGVGDFAGVLVDHGFAMVNALGARKGLPRQHEETVLHGLKDRETAAKSRAIPVGAWAKKKSAGEE